jgi:hypothetical protein
MRSHEWLPALLVGGLVLGASTGRSQEAQEKIRAVNADVPGPVHQRLNELAGNWDVAIKYKLGEKFQEGKATCEAKWILGGRFLQQEYNSRFQGEPFTVIELLGYDNARKKTIEIMMDTMSTGLMHNEGSLSDDGKVINNLGESRDPETGKAYKLRTVTTIMDHDHFTLEWFRTDLGGQENRVVSMSHTRKKP